MWDRTWHFFRASQKKQARRVLYRYVLPLRTINVKLRRLSLDDVHGVLLPALLSWRLHHVSADIPGTCIGSYAFVASSHISASWLF